MSPRKIKSVCVYASSSDALAPQYLHDARELGARIAQQGWTLVYGAGHMGLMGEVARAVHACNGEVIGVIPQKLNDMDLAYTQADELIVTDGMRDRKAVMEERSDAFIALPGGFGTLEELMEILVLKQLDYMNKPLVFLNTNGVYTHLFEFFERLIACEFIKPSHQDLYLVADTVDEAIALLEDYEPHPLEGKWF